MTIFIQGTRLLIGAALSAALLLAAPAAMADSLGLPATMAAHACAADLHLDPAAAAYSDCVSATLWNEQNIAAR
jgi:hypothetical protein